ncbi:hypothetical protein B0H11DRAFT_1930877 [Mycena galericulata]|nr:hypothetical protein B0H11DRAFT_1930877 [Mycena galericulata]
MVFKDYNQHKYTNAAPHIRLSSQICAFERTLEWPVPAGLTVWAGDLRRRPRLGAFHVEPSNPAERNQLISACFPTFREELLPHWFSCDWHNSTDVRFFFIRPHWYNLSPADAVLTHAFNVRGPLRPLSFRDLGPTRACRRWSRMYFDRMGVKEDFPADYNKIYHRIDAEQRLLAWKFERRLDPDRSLLDPGQSSGVDACLKPAVKPEYDGDARIIPRTTGNLDLEIYDHFSAFLGALASRPGSSSLFSMERQKQFIRPEIIPFNHPFSPGQAPIPFALELRVYKRSPIPASGAPPEIRAIPPGFRDFSLGKVFNTVYGGITRQAYPATRRVARVLPGGHRRVYGEITCKHTMSKEYYVDSRYAEARLDSSANGVDQQPTGLLGRASAGIAVYTPHEKGARKTGCAPCTTSEAWLDAGHVEVRTLGVKPQISHQYLYQRPTVLVRVRRALLPSGYLPARIHWIEMGNLKVPDDEYWSEMKSHSLSAVWSSEQKGSTRISSRDIESRTQIAFQPVDDEVADHSKSGSPHRVGSRHPSASRGDDRDMTW